jgi:hypothetical protein
MTKWLFPLQPICDNLSIGHDMLSVYYDMVSNTGAMPVLKRIDFNSAVPQIYIKSVSKSWQEVLLGKLAFIKDVICS